MGKKCKHCGKEEDAVQMNTKYGGCLCKRHWLQFMRYGEFLKRTIYDPNDFIIDGDTLIIKTFGKNGEPKEDIVTDSKNYDLVKDYKWYAIKGYARCSIGGRKVFMHRMIMNPKDGLFVDHIDGNGLNNKESNLRVCTTSENMRNMHKDGIIGVKWNKWNGRYKWIPKIMVNYKGVWLGAYDDKEVAIKKRLEAEAKYFGKFAPQKHLFEEYGIKIDNTSGE